MLTWSGGLYKVATVAVCLAVLAPYLAPVSLLASGGLLDRFLVTAVLAPPLMIIGVLLCLAAGALNPERRARPIALALHALMFAGLLPILPLLAVVSVMKHTGGAGPRIARIAARLRSRARLRRLSGARPPVLRGLAC